MLFGGCKTNVFYADQEIEITTSNVTDNETNESVEITSETNESSGITANYADDSVTNESTDITSNSIECYEVFEKEYTAYDDNNNPFSVIYAQISGLGDESLQFQINQVLKSSITEWINEDCKWVSEMVMEVEYKTDKYLSLCYTYEILDPRGEDFISTFVRIGLTIDMQTGERIYLKDLVSDTEKLKQILTNYSYNSEFSPPISSEEADEILNYASITEKTYFEQLFETNPYVYEYTVTYLRIKPSFYIRDNEIIITRNEYDLNDVYIDYEKIIETTNEAEMQWLEFSHTEFEAEREIVKSILADELTLIEEAYGDKEFPIAICLKDINGDGRDDIIALLFQQSYFGSHANCSIYAVLNYDGYAEGLRVAQAFVIFDDDGSQKSLSVQSSKDSSWLEFVSHVNGVVWSWNGERYIGGENSL